MAKVLLVEDDNNLREIYQARLMAEGYDIVAAQNGEEALVVAKQNKPDLIISDVMMPRISGFEMLDILRNTDELKHTKVIMLTALGQAEDQKRASGLGADKYLVKSQVTLEDIVNAAKELLGEGGAIADVPAAPAMSDPLAAAADNAASSASAIPEPPDITAPAASEVPAISHVVQPPEPVQVTATGSASAAADPAPAVVDTSASAPITVPDLSAPGAPAPSDPATSDTPAAGPGAAASSALRPDLAAVSGATTPVISVPVTDASTTTAAAPTPLPEPPAASPTTPADPTTSSSPAPEPVIAPVLPVVEPPAPAEDTAAPVISMPDSAIPAPPAAPDATTPGVAAADSTPAPEPTPAVDPAPAVQAVTSTATQTLASEGAAMQAQIDTYAQTAAEVPVAVEPAEPAPADATQTNSESNDETIADAVEELNSSAQPEPLQPPSVTAASAAAPAATAPEAPQAPAQPPVSPTPPEPPTPSVAPVSAPAEPAAATPIPVSTPGADTAADNRVTVAGKKIIQPITDPAAKPNLDALLAKEEAAAPAPPAIPMVNGAAAAPAPAEPAHLPGQSFDPNKAL